MKKIGDEGFAGVDDDAGTDAVGADTGADAIGAGGTCSSWAQMTTAAARDPRPRSGDGGGGPLFSW